MEDGEGSGRASEGRKERELQAERRWRVDDVGLARVRTIEATKRDKIRMLLTLAADALVQ